MRSDLDEALEVVAKAMSKDIKYREMEELLLGAVKKLHGIEDLYFYTGGGWFYCGTENPSKTHWMIEHPNINHHTPIQDKLWHLTSLINGNFASVLYDGERFTSMEDLKRYHLTKKLAGIKLSNIIFQTHSPI